MKAVTSEDFDSEVKQSAVPVLVDFWATWCGPCRALKPVLQGVSNIANGKYKVVTVDVDECQELAGEYRISGIPCVVVFKNGVETQRLVGLQPQEKLLEAVQ